ncbi:MAG: zinc-ribbon domain-containing protein, partial [Myxococcota bacterium]
MKFACPNCKTRYSIADEKLPTGASVKFKCKTCGTSIRLKRKPEPAAAKNAPEPVSFEETQGQAESTRVAPLGQLQELRRQAAEEEAVQKRAAQAPVAASPSPEPMGEDAAATAVVSLNQLNELRNQASQAPEISRS